MIWLRRFRFPGTGEEEQFLDPPPGSEEARRMRRTCYDSWYPFQVLPRRGLGELELGDVTILYGGNGSGKTTALNVMAAALGLEREAPINQSSFFPDYVRLCQYELARPIPPGSRAISSDDVFDYMLDLRALDQGLDRAREERFAEYLDARYATFQMRSMEDYRRLKQVNAARRKSQSQYVRATLMDNVREGSNGETAFRCFTEQVGEGGLYLLDEPENSLSPERQQELAGFLADSARYLRCQLVISTHSPFLLALEGARVYDLDGGGAVRPWTELPGVRAYRDFFRAHERDFA